MTVTDHYRGYRNSPVVNYIPNEVQLKRGKWINALLIESSRTVQTPVYLIF